MQLDPADFYGGDWATMRLDEFKKYLKGHHSHGNCITHPDFDLSLNSNAYLIDISPHVLFGAGPMISLLLGSGAHHYTEYKLIQSTLIYNEAQKAFQAVPSTRSEIFRDKTLAPLQKRVFMRFLKGCAEAIQDSGPLVDAFRDKNKLFVDLMTEEELDEALQQCVLHGVLLQGSRGLTLKAPEALNSLRSYVESCGRYGPDTGPFLTPMYGCGELPQAFCRVAAVHGAVQVLRCGIKSVVHNDSLEMENNNKTGVVIAETGQIIRADKLATTSSLAALLTADGLSLIHI